MLYNQRRYAAAIEQLDEYIVSSKNGALVTRAELLRSASYYELGLAAIEKENWVLAIRLLKLSNSEQADVELAKVYNALAMESIENLEIERSLSFLNMIVDEIPASSLIPEVLLLRIKIYLGYYEDKDKAWKDYTYLYDKYPENVYEQQARALVEDIVPLKINQAIDKALKKNYQDALNDLFIISHFPIGDHDKVDLEISNIYQEMAELKVQEQDYFEANSLFLKAILYCPEKQEAINNRLVDIAYLYLEKGNDYLRIRDFDSALKFYQRTFEIVPDFNAGKQAINNLRTFQKNIIEAEVISSEAAKLESSRNYAEAQKLYFQAYQLDKLQSYLERYNIMGNLIEAEKNPFTFAKSIILDYKNGLLNRRIQAQKQELLKRYNIDEIRDSGWKILLSSGQFKYEARYDLLTPAESIYYVWQVNLRERSVTPLNKLSEKIMQ